MIDLLGTIGPISLAVCALPQTIQVVKQGHAHGLNFPFLLLWLFGELCTFIYVAARHPESVALAANYLANVILIAIICGFRRWPQRRGWVPRVVRRR